MKKILIAFIILACSVSTKAQFNNTDTLRAFINHWIRNSAVEAFQNLRLNTALIGMTNFLDSAYGGQVLNFEAVDDTTARLVTIANDTFSIFLRGNGITALRRRPGTDSVEYLKNVGGWTFAYKDSTGGSSATLSNVGSGYRLVKTADGQVKTIFVGYGLDGDSTTNTDAITIKADTSELVTQSDLNDTARANRARYNIPPTEPYGVIYHKDAFTSTSDITAAGAFTANYSAGAIGLGGGSGTFTAYGTIGDYTLLPQWSITTTRKVNVINGTSYGFGQGVKSDNPNGQFDVLGRIVTSTGSVGNLVLNNSTGTSLATGAGPSISAGDEVELTITFNDSVVTLSARNVTTSSSTSTISYTFTTTGSPYVPNTSRFALYEFGGSDSLKAIDIRSATPRNPNVLYLTDSKGIYYAQYWATRTGKLLNINYPTTVSYNGGSDRTIETLQKLPELTKLNPAQVIMSIGSNDLRFSSTLADTKLRYDSIVKFFQNASVRVYHIVLPEDSTGTGIGLSDWKQWVSSTYSSDYIDVWTPLSTNNILKAGYQGDGVHPNQAAMKSIDSLITLSGKLVNTNDRTYQIRTTDGRIKLLKDSLYLDPSFSGSGGSGISGLSTNVIPKATSSTTIADGSITDGASLTTISNPAIINNTFKAGTNILAAEAPLTFANPTSLPSFSFYRASSGTDEKIWNWYVDGSNMYMRTVNDAQNADATAIRFHRSGNSVDYVEIGGNLGIGVTPSNKLDVNGASTFAGNMVLTGQLTTTGSSAGVLYNRRDNSASAWGILSLAGNLDFFDLVAGAEKFNILPGGKLHIYDTSRVDARMSYNSNLHSTFTTHSLVDKDYVDSVVAALGGGGLSGSGTSGRVAYWDGASSLTSAANFTFNGTTLQATNATSSSAMVGQSSSSGSGVYGASNTGTGIVGESTSGEAFNYSIFPSSTNSIVTVGRQTRWTSGTAADGIGGGYDFFTQKVSGTASVSARLTSKWTDATNGIGDFSIWVGNTGSMYRGFTLTGDRQLQLPYYGSGTFTGTPTGTLQVTSGGDVIEGPTLAEGTWTPTVTDITNATGSSVVGTGQYLRVGSKVTFSLTLSVSPTAGSSSTQVDFTLPIASSLSNAYELSGTCSGLRGRVVGQTANDRASAIFVSDVSGTETITVSVTYRIL